MKKRRLNRTGANEPVSGSKAVIDEKGCIEEVENAAKTDKEEYDAWQETLATIDPSIPASECGRESTARFKSGK